MLPSDSDILQDLTEETQPSLTYAMDISSNRVVGKCDNIDAVKQAIYKILNTERYENQIYSWNYGVELKDLFGKPISYCVPEIERRFKEAIMQDDRVENVYDFEFTYPSKRVIAVNFKVKTVEGNASIGKEVSI